MPHSALSAERLKELIHYDPDTGAFTRVVAFGRWKPGPVKITARHRGYVKIRIDGTKYAAHRLAWLYVHGEWPIKDIDHINRDRADNRIANLRECSRLQNTMNKLGPARKNGELRGAVWEPSMKKWSARIKLGSGPVRLGYFDTPAEAHAAYKEAAIKYFGEFACFESKREVTIGLDELEAA